MKVKVKAFFTLREKLGWKEKTVELPEGSTVRDLIEVFPVIKQEIERYKSKGYNMIIMVNGRHIEFLNGLDTVLKDGDEIAFFPPAAGG